MTVKELLIEAGKHGQMPEVICSFIPRHASSGRGRVTVIKDTIRFRGCAVIFPGINYDTWFYDSDDTDQRSNYMRDLSFIGEGGK